MNPVSRTKPKTPLPTWCAETIVTVFRAVFRVVECFAFGKSRDKLRELRKKLQAIDQDRRMMLQQIEHNPDGASELIDSFLARHADHHTRQMLSDDRAKIRKLRDEGAELRAIRDQEGANTAEAVASYRRYIEANPTSYLAYLYLGAALKVSGDLNGALAAYREAERHSEGTLASAATSRLNIGLVLEEMGELEAAADQFRRIIENEPSEYDASIAAAYYYLASILNKQGNRKEARAAWKQVVKRDKTKALAARARDMLKSHP